jgi:hypothetical protein
MNRRGFLASLLGLAATPIAGALPAPLAPLGGPGYLTPSWRGYTDISPRLAERELLEADPHTKYMPRTIKFRRYTPWEISKSPGTSS